MRRQSAFSMIAPRGDRPFGFGGLAPNQAQEDIKAPQGKEEEGGDECEGVDVVREDGGADTIGVMVKDMRMKIVDNILTGIA